MAVGWNGNQTLAESFDGAHWTVRATLTPDGTSYSSLTAVSGASTSVCMAVGNYADAHGNSQPFAEQWKGTSWTLAPFPVRSTAQSTSVADISCVS
ncbi:MAG TPA: hypothetical protein VIX82_16140, partial [Solirubrobacteraceae bacterium]